jgi:hypothetical protein
MRTFAAKVNQGARQGRPRRRQNPLNNRVQGRIGVDFHMRGPAQSLGPSFPGRGFGA